MQARTRTVLAVVLFVPLAAILLMTFACLPVPVGDAETAKVDDALTGAWIANPKDEEPVIVVVRPMDKHTYFVQSLQNVKKDGAEAVTVLNYRAWLSVQGGATFITCEALDNKSFLDPGSKNSDLYYWVAKVEKTADGVTLSPIKDNSDLLKDLDTQAKIEPVVAANANNPALYDDAIAFKKLDKDHLDIVGELAKKAHVGFDGK